MAHLSLTAESLTPMRWVGFTPGMSLVLLSTCLAALGLAAMPARAPKPKAMVLGTYHFANPGLDAVKVTIRDTMGDVRQREIAELNDRLAAFKPTKILVESTPDRQAALDERYHAYLEGAPLSANEVQQIGFRLGKRFGHRSLTGVDYSSDMMFDKVIAAAEAYGMTDFPAQLQETMGKLGDALNTIDRQYTVSQILAIHNSPSFIRFGQHFYTDLLRIAKHPDYPGADLLAGWYRRNLVIYQNIKNELKPGDRALVIYGSGHLYYLNQLLRDDSDVNFVDVGHYLPKPPITKVPGF